MLLFRQYCCRFGDWCNGVCSASNYEQVKSGNNFKSIYKPLKILDALFKASVWCLPYLILIQVKVTKAIRVKPDLVSSHYKVHFPASLCWILFRLDMLTSVKIEKAAKGQSNFGVESGMVSSDNYMCNDLALPTEFVMELWRAFETSLDWVHNMAYWPNWLPPVTMRQQKLDQHKQRHTAKQQQFSVACLSSDGSETTPTSIEMHGMNYFMQMFN